MRQKTLLLVTILSFSLIAILTSCGTPKAVSTLVGGEYNEDKDVTEYFVIPYGQVSLPGKWEKGDYVSNSGQQFFHNQESVTIAIAFSNSSRGYEFNPNGSLKGYDFLKAYYEWESEYYSTIGLESQIIESDQSKPYIIWRVYGQKLNTYFLFGERNGNVSNFSISITDKWTADEKVQFLKNIFLGR